MKYKRCNKQFFDRLVISVDQTLKKVDSDYPTQSIEQIHSQFKHLAELKMKVNEELQPEPTKRNYSYSRALSVTPCRADNLNASRVFFTRAQTEISCEEWIFNLVEFNLISVERSTC